MASAMKTPSLSRGILISFDGVDSSGKATQAQELANRLRYSGYTVQQFQTPDYSLKTGKELKARLQNKMGLWAEFPWEDKMKLFAQNRAEHKENVQLALSRGEIVIYDRYVPSSLAFIVVEALGAQESDLFRERIWRTVRQHEYEYNGMPREDVSIFLDVPPGISATLLEKRKEKLQDADEYTDHLTIQQRLYNEYDVLTKQDPQHYLRIRGVAGNNLLSISAVAELVWLGLSERIPELSSRHNV